MQTEIPLPQGLFLRIQDSPTAEGSFATSRLQRGLLLYDGDQDLSQEAVGFGLPVIKRGLQTIFPGSAIVETQTVRSTHSIQARYHLDRIERLSRGTRGNVEHPLFYSVKSLLEATMRRLPFSRDPLTTASNELRRLLGWKTTYAPGGFETDLTVIYAVDAKAGTVLIDLDSRDLHPSVTEIVLMHEQAGRDFDLYQDSSGARLRGDQIGMWDEVHAARAWFESSAHRVSFGLAALAGARLFRGRELIGSRLAWAGFGYSFPPGFGNTRHEIRVSRLP